MTEDFLHYIWRTHNFNFTNLKTTDGLPVEILDFGRWNVHGGPDFGLARARIDGTTLAGSVEIHIASSEWLRHGHTNDPAYENVILHVVLEEDLPAFAGPRKIPCVELRDRIDSRLLSQYLRLQSAEHWVPCASSIGEVPALIRSQWLERMCAERLESRAGDIREFLQESRNDWDVALYYCLARAFGFSLNSAPFLRMARLLPLSVIYKHCDHAEQIEALVFGCAGLLNTVFIDTYPVLLQKEFYHLSSKFSLDAIDARAWNWGRIRPGNFPSIRLAQFSAVLLTFQDLSRQILESPDTVTLHSCLRGAVSPYWNTHTAFDRPAKYEVREMGKNSIDRILINAIIPYLYCFGLMHDDENYKQYAIELATTLAPEVNAITRKWEGLEMPNTHMGQSQGLLQLKKTYCDHHRCVACSIGNYILTTGKS